MIPLAVGVWVAVIELEIVIEGVKLKDIVDEAVDVDVADEVAVDELVNVRLDV